MAVGDKFDVTLEVKRVLYYKNNWGILQCSVVHSKPVLNKNKIVIKGEMPAPVLQETYVGTITEIEDLKYGRQYEINKIALDIEVKSEEGKKQFLKKLFTSNQVEAMYDALEDPFTVLKEGEVEKLLHVKGGGIYTVPKWIERFQENFYLHRLYVELPEYHLTPSVIDKLMRKYKSPDVIISKVKDNPYSLCEVDGIGWKTVDFLALQSGMDQYDSKRISGWVIHYLESQGKNGISWVTSDELMISILSNIGEEVPDNAISEAMTSIEDTLWFNENKTRFALKYYYNLEEEIAEHFLRLLKCDTQWDVPNWREVVKRQELEQGWEYTDQQIEGIESILKNSVTVIHGLAGCGKSTIVNVVLKILEDKYSYAMCALAGRAGVRLSDISGKQGYTIHRLLDNRVDGMSKQYNRRFYFFEERPLPYDIIIVDEISMIGGSLFRDLLRAVKNGCKLILLGDIGQLESIGECKVAYDIINSPVIPTVYLDKIHRQAQKSAIITESINMRKGKQILESDDWAGIETRGELQDLTLDIYSDKSNSLYHTIEHVKDYLEKGVNILDVQVMCPVKERGQACTSNLNNLIQELYNSASEDKSEIKMSKGYVLREGDKIINTKNTRDVFDIDAQDVTTIYNGNIGIIYKINEEENTMIVDFFERGRVLLTSNNLTNIELGYAITVHKMQGDQKDYVIGVIDFSAYSMLSRELLYTLTTRAIKHCTIVAQNSALCYAINRESIQTKRSFLQDILYVKTNEKFVF